MSFIDPIELGRSTANNIKNLTWSVHDCYKLYEDDGKALVAYIKSLEAEIKKLKENNEQ